MSRLVLLAGVNGYVGSRLLPLLASPSQRVRCIAGWADTLWDRVPEGVELLRGDLHDPAFLAAALAGVDCALYIRPVLTAIGESFDAGRSEARLFGAAARAAGARRIVYFGGFGAERLTQGVRRDVVGDALGSAGIPTLELRASAIIGPGSLSFEMIRALVERLPVIPSPRWMRMPLRPIFIGDLLACLVESLDIPADGNRVFSVGGADVVTFAGLLEAYARVRGLRRWLLPVPAHARGLSRLALGLVAPKYARVAGLMIEHMPDLPSADDERAGAPFTTRPMGVLDALTRTMGSEDAGLARTRWSQVVSAEDAVRPWGGARYGNRLVDSRVAAVAAPPDAVFAAVERIGGAQGWYSTQWLWALRGWMDEVVGGAGMRPGRADPDRLAVGNIVDCWRVAALDRDRRLLLAAEMKLPGRGWLEFEVHAGADGRTTSLRQTALFDPLGLAGLLYWLASWPFHQWVFAQMILGIAREAERRATAIDRDTTPPTMAT